MASNISASRVVKGRLQFTVFFREDFNFSLLFDVNVQVQNDFQILVKCSWLV